MDENKIMEAMKGIYDSLSDEQKERADKVDSYEAFMKFMDEENIELPEELMEDAAGGFKWFWPKGGEKKRDESYEWKDLGEDIAGWFKKW